MPSAKFVYPKKLDTLPANTKFTIQLAIRNPINAITQLGPDGTILGHIHVAIGDIGALDSVEVTNPNRSVFFKSITEPLRNGQVSAVVKSGAPAGGAIAEHGNLDDCVYVWTIDSSRMS
ncbi:hypothetical protein DFH08DRAFT_988950 [Mycena albidolilacea]|uniref:Uncharacterized protein n=1 Tax=Mycena albidolilacea TaxID=1033008 RepID=A0AAD6Z0J0_9AGAR|nr:hypothetical protein DFH08DRAFT_988950 [Mycena albidolilacea]